MDQEAPIERRRRAKAPPNDWRNLLCSAASDEDVIGLVRDHLAMWSPDEIARLPVDCRPCRIHDAEDITRWAFQLASAHCAGTIARDDEFLLDRILELVTQAAMRLSQLNAAAPEQPAN